jgi:hypothetical protein
MIVNENSVGEGMYPTALTEAGQPHPGCGVQLVVLPVVTGNHTNELS